MSVFLWVKVRKEDREAGRQTGVGIFMSYIGKLYGRGIGQHKIIQGNFITTKKQATCLVPSPITGS